MLIPLPTGVGGGAQAAGEPRRTRAEEKEPSSTWPTPGLGVTAHTRGWRRERTACRGTHSPWSERGSGQTPKARSFSAL